MKTEITSANADRSKDDVTDAREVARLRDTSTPIRMGFWVLVVGVGLFLLWAAFAPLDEGVPAPAIVAAEARRNTIQHLQGGVVKAVHVKDGVEVKSGDLLIELDDAMVRAGHQMARQQYLYQRALEARLNAELTGARVLVFHQDLQGSDDPLAVQHMTIQNQLFSARLASRAAERAAAEQAISGAKSQVAAMEQALRERRSQAGVQSRQLQAVRNLAEEGFAPNNQALQLEQGQAELRASISNLEAELRRLQSATSEQRLRMEVRAQDYTKEVSAQLADLRREVQANQERMTATERELARMHIRAPVAGQVIGLAIRTPGGVVQQGQVLMDILPRGVPLILDVKIPPQVIDTVKLGQEVEVRFAAFASTPHLVVLGRLVSLSGDVSTEHIGGNAQTYYAARVELTPAGMAALGSQRVQPGMHAEVLIRTGERSLLDYLLGPMLKRVSVALTER